MQKGRVAAEIESVDELLGTELLLSGMLMELTAAEVVALLSCLFDQQRSADKTPSTSPLIKAFAQLQEHARAIAKVSIECMAHYVTYATACGYGVWCGHYV